MRSRSPKTPAAALISLLALAVACGPGSESRKVADGAGARRIIAVAPSLVEILFALDLGQRVVGVGDYAEWPPEAAALPRIGGLFDPRFETIAALDPDLAVLLPSEESLAGELERLGIETLIVRQETLAEIEGSMRAIAERAGVAERGRRLVEEFRRGLRERRRDRRPRVLLLVGRQAGRLGELTAAGAGTYLAELVRRLGAENVLADLEQPYPQVGLETILDRQPSLIVELQPVRLAPEAAAELISEWERLPELEAVERDCVRVISGGHVLIPGPRLVRLYEELGAAIEACAPGAD